MRGPDEILVSERAVAHRPQQGHASRHSTSASHLVEVVHLHHHAAEDVPGERKGLPFEQLVGAAEGELERDAQRLALDHRERAYQ